MSTARPALAELQERLAANGVVGDPERVATAILGLAHQNEWTERPERISEWLSQLAMDLAGSTLRASAR